MRELILNLLRRYKTAGLGDNEDRIVPHAANGRGFGAGSVELLTEIREAARLLRQTVAKSDQ